MYEVTREEEDRTETRHPHTYLLDELNRTNSNRHTHNHFGNKQRRLPRRFL